MRIIDVPWLRDMTMKEARAFVMAQKPGLRCTLTQGSPVADGTSVTSIYAEPMDGGVVGLFKDAAGTIPRIMLLPPSTLSLALGTLASASIPNDVFAYDAGAGSIGLEKLPWTNATTRATAVDSVSGRYYKNGDYSRLLVASFYPASTTTVHDNALHRYLYNIYNQRERNLAMDNTTSHTYNGGYQEWNGGGSRVDFMVGVPDNTVIMGVVGELGVLSGGTFAIAAQAMDTTTAYDTFFYVSSTTTGLGAGSMSTYSPTAGYHYVAALESTASTGANQFTQIHLRGKISA